jgi:hypothetical protein
MSARRNFLRTGTLQNKSFTSTSVPVGQPQEHTSSRLPALTLTSVPSSLSAVLVAIENLDTEAIEGIVSYVGR